MRCPNCKNPNVEMFDGCTLSNAFQADEFAERCGICPECDRVVGAKFLPKAGLEKDGHALTCSKCGSEEVERMMGCRIVNPGTDQEIVELPWECEDCGNIGHIPLYLDLSSIESKVLPDAPTGEAKSPSEGE